MKNRKDFYLVAIIGFCVGWLLLMPLKNLGFEIRPLLIFASVAGFTIFAPIALAILNFFGRFWPLLNQLGKFLATGSLNFFLDFGVLNLLIFLTDISRGGYYVVFKVISFLAASTNSYFWNKFWVFGSRGKTTAGEYGLFFMLTAIGAVINIGIAALVVNVIGAPNGISLKIWSNVGALIAVIFSLFWNFISYKFFVFKPKQNTKPINA